MKKYELLKEIKNGLRQIRALRDIPKAGVKGGELGGWLKSEANLAQDDGNAWVYDNARVSGDARVSGNACVYGDARVSGNACVYGDAWVYDNARVSGDARVSGNAQVSGDAQVRETAITATRSDGYTFLLARDHKTGRCVIIAGCRYFNMKQARAHWKATRGGTRLGEETFAILDYFKRRAKLLGWET